LTLRLQSHSGEAELLALSDVEELKEKIEEGKKIIEKASFLKYAMGRDQNMQCVHLSCPSFYLLAGPS
jgi:hypothetical protein